MKLKQRLILYVLMTLMNVMTFMPALADGPDEINVLFISSWNENLPWHKEVKKGFEEYINNNLSKPNIFYEYMDSVRFSSKEHVSIFTKYLTGKYSVQHIDFVIYEGASAGNLFKSYPELFQTSRKIALNPGLVLENIPSSETSMILPVNVDYERAAQELLKVSKGKTIYLVAGTTTFGQKRVKKITEVISGLDPNKKIIPLVGLPMHELVEKVSRLDSKSIIYYLLIFQDGEGTRFIPYDAAEQICRKARVPVYSLWTSLMGSGIVGGYLLSGEKVGHVVASIVMNPYIVRTTDLKSLAGKFHGFYYDWRKLKSLNIKETSLPPESIVLFKRPSFYKHYYREIIFGSLTIILVISFFWNLRLKKEVAERLAVEQKLRESENKYRTLSDAAFEGIVILDKGIIVESNSTFAKMFGYSSSTEFIGKRAIDMVNPEDQDAVQNKIETGYEEPYETNGYKKDCTSFPIEVRGRMFLYNQQQVRVTAVRDLTEIKESQEEIKTLKGIIPICMHCKEIRDDKGYWNQLEKYIADHSDAQFSHGICDKCLKEHYPDIED